jgi:hypothetical protein
MKTRDEIADAHDRLAELHEYLARNAVLDLIHEFHDGFAARLREEAAQWRAMKDSTFESSTRGWEPK